VIQVVLIHFFHDATFFCVKKENVHGLVYTGQYAKSILKRAAERYVVKSLVCCIGGQALGIPVRFLSRDALNDSPTLID
jgi:hypothetical protein